MSAPASTLTERATAFVAEAERMTNERDVDGIREVFAPDGRWTATIDGLLLRAEGIDEIHRGWGTMCRFMAARRMLLAHPLTAVAFARAQA